MSRNAPEALNAHETTSFRCPPATRAEAGRLPATPVRFFASSLLGSVHARTSQFAEPHAKTSPPGLHAHESTARGGASRSSGSAPRASAAAATEAEATNAAEALRYAAAFSSRVSRRGAPAPLGENASRTTGGATLESSRAFHSLRVPSQLAERRALGATGENLASETMSPWPTSVAHGSPEARNHVRMVKSNDADATSSFEALTSRYAISPRWPRQACIKSPVSVDQIFTRWSSEPVTTRRPVLSKMMQ